MTKARDIADFKFENITDTGTEGTKVASGTTAQRGSTAGQFRFNTTTGKFEGRNSTNFVAIEANPVVSSVNVSNITQAQIDAGFDLVITGENFFTGDVVKFIANDNTEFSSPTVTINSVSQITARVTPTIDSTKEPYKVQVTSSGGLTGSLASAFNIDAAPVWTTAAGNIGTVEETNSANITIAATDAEGDAITYAETGGTVLSGAGFSMSSGGVITGTAPSVSGNTTYTFNARATSGTNFTDRTFNIIVSDSPSGGTITTYNDGSNNYRIHAFTSNGTFILYAAKTIDVLVVGGGGAGGGNNTGSSAGGGGGGGGIVYSTSLSLASGNRTITIGNGGTGTANSDAAAQGASSIFDFGGSNEITAYGGGGGSGGNGGYDAPSYTNYGAGGGGADDANGAAATSQGNAGGNGAYSSSAQNGGSDGTKAGGGGGGGDSTYSAGNGGNGGNYSSYFGTTYGQSGVFAGGGGGGASGQAAGNGGTGGGGNGSGSTNGANATANTGGGGGASSANSTYTGGNGGSGIVLIRYQI